MFILRILLGITILVVTSAPIITQAAFTRQLSLGSVGADVQELQLFLKNNGFFVLDETTNYFGALTKDALAKYQVSVGLEPVGSVGPKTLELLQQSASITKAPIDPLRLGARGAHVAHLQTVLRQLGYFTYPEITEYFGVITETAVRAFQVAHGLEGVGYVGPLTYAALQAYENISSEEEKPRSVVRRGGGGSPSAPSVPFSISNVQVTAGTSTATITWSTSKDAISDIEYWFHPLVRVIASSSDATNNHTFVLSGLFAGTTYEYLLTSEYTGGEIATTTVATFTTTSGEVEDETTLGTKQLALILAGDSRTASYSSLPDMSRTFTHNYLAQLNMRHGHPFEAQYYAASYGATVAQMRTGWEAALAEKSTNPNYVNAISMLGGVNSIAAYGDGATLAATLITMAEEALQAGVVPILYTDPGADNLTDTRLAELFELNETLRAYVASKQGYSRLHRPHLVDLAAVMWANNPVEDGFITFKSGYYRDETPDVHFSTNGAVAAAQATNAVLREISNPARFIPTVASNIIVNNAYTATTTPGAGFSGVIPANHVLARDNAAVSGVASLDENKTLSITATTSASLLSYSGFTFRPTGAYFNSGWTTGDVIEFFVPLRLLAGAQKVASIQARIQITYTDGTTQNINYEAFHSDGGEVAGTGNPWGAIPADETVSLDLRMPPITVLGAVNSVVPQIIVNFRNGENLTGATVEIDPSTIIIGKKI